MKKLSIILNLTQHSATTEQKKAGLVDLPTKYQERLKELLTFEELPTDLDIKDRAMSIYDLVVEFVTDDLSPIRDEIKEIGVEKFEDGHLKVADEDEFKKFGFGFMIGGALWLMKPLIEELENIGTPLFAFSKRETIEKQRKNGEVIKTNVFKHIGFVEAI